MPLLLDPHFFFQLAMQTCPPLRITCGLLCDIAQSDPDCKGVCFGDHKHDDGWVNAQGVPRNHIINLRDLLLGRGFNGTVADMWTTVQYLNMDGELKYKVKMEILRHWHPSRIMSDLKTLWEVFQVWETKSISALRSLDACNPRILLDLHLHRPNPKSVLVFCKRLFGVLYSSTQLTIPAAWFYTHLDRKAVRAVMPRLELPGNAVIAGGALVHLLDAKIPRYPTSDVDIFYFGEFQDPSSVVEQLLKQGYVLGYYGSSVLQAYHPNPLIQHRKIQIISSDASSAAGVVATFDYGHNMVWFDGERLCMNLLALQAWSEHTLLPSIAERLVPRRRKIKAMLKGFGEVKDVTDWELQAAKYTTIPESAQTDDEVRHWMRYIYRMREFVTDVKTLRPLEPLKGHMLDYSRQDDLRVVSKRKSSPNLGFMVMVTGKLLTLPRLQVGPCGNIDSENRIKLILDPNDYPAVLCDIADKARSLVRGLGRREFKPLSANDAAGQWPYAHRAHRISGTNIIYHDVRLVVGNLTVFYDTDGTEIPPPDHLYRRWVESVVRPRCIHARAITFDAVSIRLV